MTGGRAVQFQVDGKPEPQGSTRTFLIKGRPVTTSTNYENGSL